MRDAINLRNFNTGDRCFLHGSGLHWGRVSTHDGLKNGVCFPFVVVLFCWAVGRYMGRLVVCF